MLDTAVGECLVRFLKLLVKWVWMSHRYIGVLWWLSSSEHARARRTKSRGPPAGQDFLTSNIYIYKVCSLSLLWRCCGWCKRDTGEDTFSPHTHQWPRFGFSPHQWVTGEKRAFSDFNKREQLGSFSRTGLLLTTVTEINWAEEEAECR